MKLDDLRLTGRERIRIFSKYKADHPDPELIEPSDFGMVNRLLDAQLQKLQDKANELDKVICFVPTGWKGFDYKCSIDHFSWADYTPEDAYERAINDYTQSINKQIEIVE